MAPSAGHFHGPHTKLLIPLPWNFSDPLFVPEGTIVLEIYGQMYFIYFLSFMKIMNEMLTVFNEKCIVFTPYLFYYY